MAGIGWYYLDEVFNLESPEIKVNCCVNVFAVLKQENFLSLNIGDSTCSVEAVLYEQKLVYEDLKLPKKGDIIMIMGSPTLKQIKKGEQTIKKLKIHKFQIISYKEEMYLIDKIYKSKIRRYQQKLLQQQVTLKMVKRVKEKYFQENQLVEIRSLILSYLYIVFSNNKDLVSYTFNCKMVITHKMCKQYAISRQIPQKSFKQVIQKAISYLQDFKIIQKKNQSKGQAFYIVKKIYFDNLVLEIENIIYKNKTSGIRLQNINNLINQSRGCLQIQKQMFDTKFLQKILTDLIQGERIYKTSDKLLYPFRR